MCCIYKFSTILDLSVFLFPSDRLSLIVIAVNAFRFCFSEDVLLAPFLKQLYQGVIHTAYSSPIQRV